MPLRFAAPLPPSFDPAFYRARHPEIGLRHDNDASEHYRREGREHGLIGSAMALREAVAAAIDTTRPVLEIGPFCAPLLTGPCVEYLDRLDANGLRARADALGLDSARCPERIHHVGSLRTVASGHFDAALASHAIEHQPDLVRHLEEVARVLRPNGRYFLIIPDKRFCFDHFLPESTIAGVLEAFHGERVEHRFASVVEHVALVTHNDPVRHWRGDHGEVGAIERRRRVGEALSLWRSGEGEYLDVHAWQFTPESFADLLDTLARLELCAFEVERVYDTPRDRAEFCAVLRRARPARRAARRNAGPPVRLLQTADPHRYAPMLAITQPNVAEYARRHGFEYESFVGLKRGAWSWQASFNRIPMLDELVARGEWGWALFLDADAYVRDLDFDLAAYLAHHAGHAAILATSGMTGEQWDVNSGVILVNLDHALGRKLVRSWAERFAAISDQQLRERREWDHRDDDQDLLQQLLREEPEIAGAVHVESMDLLNSAHARFIRQRLRAQFGSLEERMAALRDEVAAVGAAFGVGGDMPAPPPGGRVAARLLHHLEVECWLDEAPPGQGGPAADEALRVWQEERRTPRTGSSDELATLLARADRAGVAELIAHLGRSSAGRGVLGGDRQHRRVSEDPVFARERATRTHDALLSFAELTGAVPLESPDTGPWGITRRHDAPSLFEAVERTLGADLAPPETIGAYLGIAVGRGRVLHLRMIEAMFTAWRVRQLCALLGLRHVLELGGGIGLGAWYARRLGSTTYRLAPTDMAGALQAGVLAQMDPPVPIARPGDAPVDLLVAEDLPAMPAEWVAGALDAAVRRGARALLGVAQDRPADWGGRGTARMLSTAADGWQLVGRTRHGLKPGYVEELFVRSR